MSLAGAPPVSERRDLLEDGVRPIRCRLVCVDRDTGDRDVLSLP